jgi:YbgC/YbaW family acyl-CoA thioester hydrolase
MRIKLEQPQQYIFSMHLTVRVSDLNYGNHLSNDRLLTYAHQARVELFQSWGFSEMNFAGKGVIMTDAAIVFKSEGHLNDELRIDVAVEDISKIGFDLYYKVINTKTEKEVAEIKTGILCFDYQLKKVVAIPEEIVQILNKL